MQTESYLKGLSSSGDFLRSNFVDSVEAVRKEGLTDVEFLKGVVVGLSSSFDEEVSEPELAILIQKVICVPNSKDSSIVTRMIGNDKDLFLNDRGYIEATLEIHGIRTSKSYHGLDGKRVRYYNVDEIRSKTSTSKLFDYICAEFRRSRKYDVSFPLKEYMDLRGMTNEEESIEQIKDDLDSLSCVTVTIGNMFYRLGGGTCGVLNGEIFFRLNHDFLDLFGGGGTRSYIQIPEFYFKLDDNKYRDAAFFYRRIIEHHKMNRKKSNANLIGVMVLLDSSPNYPQYVPGTQPRRVKDQIERFINNMNGLHEGVEWNFKDGVVPKKWVEFKNSIIEFTLLIDNNGKKH